MKYISDEILNKYIDGELIPEEINNIDELLLKDVKLKKRLSTLKRVDTELKKIRVDEVSVAFTQRVMQRISKKYRVPKEQKLFITYIVSSFGVLCLSFIGYIVINIAGEVSEAISAGAEKTVSYYSQSLIQSLVNIFSGLSISVFGSILSIVLLVSGYFFFEMSKQSKTKLSN